MTYDPRIDHSYFDWDTSRRARAPGQAPEVAVDWLKELGKILAILIGLAAIAAGIVALGCFLLLTL